MPVSKPDPGFQLTPAQRVGYGAEDRAAAYLTDRGLTILSRNYRTRLGEIDLIARDGEVLVFVEVRMRAGSRFGGAPASVTCYKQRRIALAAAMYLRQFRRQPRCRFDVIAIEGESLDWMRAAFEAG